MSGRRAQSLPAHMLEPAKPERGRCVTAICFSWKVITCIVSHVTLVLLVVSYCVGGAYLFQHLERPHELEVKKGIHNLRLNLTDKIWNHSDNLTVLNEVTWTNFVKDDLQMFEKQILTAIKTNGWDGDEDVMKSQWTFAGSLFYSIIVITTIGYGHISPRTDWGKVTTIFYAIVGIPLMLLCLSNIGDVMATSFRFIYWRVCCYVCTRTSKKSRARPRQRSVKGHRYSSRSQPPPFRRSIKMSQRSGHGGHMGGGLQHAYSDPELRTVGRNDYDRDFEYERPSDRRMHRADTRGGSDRRREHLMNMAPPPPRGSTRHLPPYEDPYYFPDDGPSYTQTLNRGRFSNRQRNRERMRDRHTVERERHLSRSKQHFDSMEDLDDLPPTKRAMSVRSVRTPRRDEISRETRESRELNRLNSHHGMPRGKSMPNSNARTRAKSVDPRLSAAPFEEVDEEIVRKTPIISNRYAIVEMEHRESRNKTYLRSQSMPRSAFHKNNLNHTSSRHYEDELPNHVNNHQSNQRHQTPRRASLGRQTSLGPPITNSRYGNHLELPEFTNHHGHRMKRGVSPRRHEIYEEDYDETFLEEPEEHIHMSRRGGSVRDYDDMDYYSPRSSTRRKRSPRKEKQERLPPSPRIMSPMGFAVKRQVRRRPSYEYDDDSQYGDDWGDYYSDISPKDRPVPIWLCVFLVISYILGGAALFAYWEEWSFLDSAYFCFITLTTIGFGDFVPAKGVKDESEQSIAYCSLYLLFGIALLAMSFNLVQEEFIANVKEVARRLGILKDEDDDDD